ncbi:hypothetical protein LR48_Vigan03g164300 [Vigna angularis]|uniref:Uncharacterized protein n=1 Tax=Phaseolus angularis TaxID=3914 RepID=A0A0L9U665_PHAAN|nr:hypothetical protein LR48_Vigan03g164300 [Vigna angularis]
MKLMKEVKRDRDGIRKGHKKWKRRETASTAQRKLPLSSTLKDPLAPLRGEMPLRGRNDHTLLPQSDPFLGLGLLFSIWRSHVAAWKQSPAGQLSSFHVHVQLKQGSTGGPHLHFPSSLVVGPAEVTFSNLVSTRKSPPRPEAITRSSTSRSHLEVHPAKQRGCPEKLPHSFIFQLEEVKESAVHMRKQRPRTRDPRSMRESRHVGKWCGSFTLNWRAEGRVAAATRQFFLVRVFGF